MDRNKIILLGVVSAVLLGLLIWSGYRGSYINKITNPEGNSVNVIYDKDLETVQGGTREKIDEDNIVLAPDKNDTVVPEGVAVPQDVITRPESENPSGSAFRDFNIKGENGRYTPDTIIVNELDVVNINFQSVDRDYNVFFSDFGIYKTIKKGVTGQIQFQAYPFGKYTFFCKDVCKDEVVGTFIVNKK